jgi:hypothetical protein
MGYEKNIADNKQGKAKVRKKAVGNTTQYF